jgi:predicted transcriptional regulator
VTESALLFVAQNYRFTNALSEFGVTKMVGVQIVRKSKLESYEAILEALVKKPQPIERLAYETDMDCALVSKLLGFLAENGLVKERPLPKSTQYAITERGVAVFKTLNFRKYLEKVSTSLSTLNDAMQTLPILSRDYEDQSEGQNEKY